MRPLSLLEVEDWGDQVGFGGKLGSVGRGAGMALDPGFALLDVVTAESVEDAVLLC